MYCRQYWDLEVSLPGERAPQLWTCTLLSWGPRFSSQCSCQATLSYLYVTPAPEKCKTSDLLSIHTHMHAPTHRHMHTHSLKLNKTFNKIYLRKSSNLPMSHRALSSWGETLKKRFAFIIAADLNSTKDHHSFLSLLAVSQFSPHPDIT